MATKNNAIISPEYLNFKDEIAVRIRPTRYETLKAVNREMIALYREIGKRITEQQVALDWGKSVVENLSRDIQKEFPGIKRFGVSNMWDMAHFYAEYRSNVILQPLVGEISWSKHIVILTKCKHSCSGILFSVAKKYLFGDKTSVDMASQVIEREKFSAADRRKHTSCFIQSEV